MDISVKIRLARDRVKETLKGEGNPPQLFTPGEFVASKDGFMKGHGTHIDGDDIKSSVVGVAEKVNKLISIKPLKGRYCGQIGDVIVGRITEVQQKQWKVNTNSHLDSVLLLSSVNLLGGELRRRSEEDVQMMRKYFNEGDLISAEVQNIFDDGVLSLSLRSLKYGKLAQGLFIKVPSTLIMRRKIHFHNMLCGASVILGNNGFIWIAPTFNPEEATGGFTQNLQEVVPIADRSIIVRLRNCILALAEHHVMLYDTSITYAFEESKKYALNKMAEQEAVYDIAFLTKQRLNEHNNQ